MMLPDPSHEQYLAQWSALYEGKNYHEGAAGYFLTKSHEWCERPFSAETKFDRVLEVGAGTGVHLSHVRHQFDEYVLTDLCAPMLDLARGREHSIQGRVRILSQDATALEFEEHSFDRVIAAHVLEHLPEPHKVLREWYRVLRPGGVMSLVLPCDPGIGWRVGRALAARKKFIRAGLEYDYWMAREHINAINNLVSLIRYYYPGRLSESWKPLGMPSMDLNLFYIAHIRKA